MKRIVACFMFVIVFILPANAAKTKVPHTLNGYINGIAVSPEGKFVACGLRDSVLQLWDVRRGTLYRNLPNSKYETPLLWVKNENRLVTQYYKRFEKDKTVNQYHVCVRQMPSGKVIQTFPNMHGTIWSDGKIIRVTDGSMIRTWRISDATLLYGHLLAPAPKSQTSHLPTGNIAFSQNGKFLIREGMFYVSVWSTSSGKVLHNIKKADTLASQVGIGVELSAISNNGRYIVFQGEDPKWKLPYDEWGDLCQRPSCYNRELTLELWDLQTNKRIRAWRGYWSGNLGATLLQFSNDNMTLYTGDKGAKSRIYNVLSGKERHVNFHGIQYLSQNNKFWAFGYDHVIRIVSVKIGKVLGIVPKR